jgi:hypothetical protein
MTELLSDSLERHLPLPKRWGMKFHLLLCGTCRRYRKHLLFMQKIMDGRGKMLPLPEAAKQRIKEKLAEKGKQ